VSVDAAAPASTARELVRLFRLRDWIKSAFIALPLPFAWAAGARLDPGPLALGTLGFCLLASAVYAANDSADAERDRLHANKRTRPIASGAISVRTALAWAAALGIGGVLLLAATGRPNAVAIGLLYVALNAAYSLGLKDVPLVDVFLLSSGYVLRVVLGCALVDVPPSAWLLLCSSALALLLGLGKRRAEFESESAMEHRPSLAGYDRDFLHLAMGALVAAALVSYGLYSIEAEVFQPGREFASLPFVCFGLLEYLRIAIVERRGGSPVDAVLHSKSLLAAAIGWGVAASWSVGLF
jgi:decaprenyl-phosphate phosphoribosyltransferase